jgi:toxin YoeB
LKYDYAGCWSGRLTKEHRIVYQVEADEIKVVSVMYHYV